MIAAVRSEWLKLRTVTSTVVLLLVVVVASVGIGVLATASVPLDDPDVVTKVSDRITYALSGVNLSLTLLAVVGVLLVTQEFRFGTSRVTFAAEPRRARVLVAKALVVAVVAAVLSAVMVALSTAVGAVILDARGSPIDFGLAGTTHVLVGAVLLSGVYAVVGLAVGAVVRSQALALVLVIVWPLLVEGIVGGIFPSVGKWLPFRAASAMLQIDPGSEHLDPWVGLGYLALVTLGLFVLGVALVRRRDA